MRSPRPRRAEDCSPGACSRGVPQMFRKTAWHRNGRRARRRIRLSRMSDWCGREDSNFHGLSPTTTSTLRVYQFRHDRIIARSLNRPPRGRCAPLAKRQHPRKRGRGTFRAGILTLREHTYPDISKLGEHLSNHGSRCHLPRSFSPLPPVLSHLPAATQPKGRKSNASACRSRSCGR